jgi:hypothetical protein
MRLTFDRIVPRRHRIEDRDDIEPILDDFTQDEIPRTAIMMITQDTRIAASTLSFSRQVRRRPETSDWFALVQEHPAHRVFSHETGGHSGN